MIPQRGGKYKQVNLRKAKKRDAEPLSDCRQKAILPRRGRIALSANERIAEFLDFAIQAKFAYVNKLRARTARPCMGFRILFRIRSFIPVSATGRRSNPDPRFRRASADKTPRCRSSPRCPCRESAAASQAERLPFGICRSSCCASRCCSPRRPPMRPSLRRFRRQPASPCRSKAPPPHVENWRRYPRRVRPARSGAVYAPC